MNIDLNTCTPGQYLRSVHGALLVYVGRRANGAPYNHEIKFADGSGGGTRADDGRVSVVKPLSMDHDIAEVLPVGFVPPLTKNGIEVRVGQVWRDLDKRMNGREVVVVEVARGKAITRANLGGRFTAKKNRPISISRMHRHSTGWMLVSGATGEKPRR